MTARILTRREASELGGVSEVTVKKAIDNEVVPVLEAGARAGIDVDDVVVLSLFELLGEVRLSPERKRELRLWARADRRTEFELAPAVVVRWPARLDETSERVARYAALRDRWIVSDPAVKGGDAVIAGTRVSVHTLASRIAEGEPEAVLAEDFPHVPAEAREVAVAYARANPRRGRPPRPAG